MVCDTRTTPAAIRRRRRCARCDRKTTTYEVELPRIGEAILVRRVSGGVLFEAVQPRPAVVLDTVETLAPKARGKK